MAHSMEVQDMRSVSERGAQQDDAHLTEQRPPALVQTFSRLLCVGILATLVAYLTLLGNAILEREFGWRYAELVRLQDTHARIVGYTQRLGESLSGGQIPFLRLASDIAIPDKSIVNVPATAWTHSFSFVAASRELVTQERLLAAWRMAIHEFAAWQQGGPTVTTVFLSSKGDFAIRIPALDDTSEAPEVYLARDRQLLERFIEFRRDLDWNRQVLVVPGASVKEATNIFYYVKPVAAVSGALAEGGTMMVAANARQYSILSNVAMHMAQNFAIYLPDGRPLFVGAGARDIRPQISGPAGQRERYDFQLRRVLIYSRDGPLTIVMAVPYGDLVGPYAWRIALPIAAALLALALVMFGKWRIYRDILRPSAARLQQLRDSGALVTTVLQAAPAGIFVLKHGQVEPSIANDRARALLQRPVVGDARHPLLGELIGRDTSPAPGEVRVTLPDGQACDLLVTSSQIQYGGESARLCTLTDISDNKRAEAALVEASTSAERARAAADAANQAKTLFLSTMSHEIRTPLHGMLGTLELMGHADMPASQRRWLERAEGSARSLLEVVDEVLDFSKIESGEIHLEHTPFDPVALIESVVLAYASLAHQKGLVLQCALRPDVDIRLLGDPGRLRQVASNLLNNAIKFTEVGRVFVRLDIDMGADDDESDDFDDADDGGPVAMPQAAIRVQVADSGIGIAPEQQRQLFEPFVQARAGNTPGTGLGLAISRRLANLMHGDIDLVSTPGVGSSFVLLADLSVERVQPVAAVLEGIRVVLRASVRDIRDNLTNLLAARGAEVRLQGDPLPGDAEPGQYLLVVSDDDVRPTREEVGGYAAVVQLTSLPLLDEDEAWLFETDPYSHANIVDAVLRAAGRRVAHAAHTTITTRSLGLHVAVIDDHPVSRELLAEQLAHLGCKAYCYRDAETALKDLARIDVDVALVDINLPGMSGYDFTRQAKRAGHLWPVIGTSANAVLTESQRAREAGMHDYLVKPISLEQLRAALVKHAPAEPADVGSAADRLGDAGGVIHSEHLRKTFLRALDADWRALNQAVGQSNFAVATEHAHRLKGGFAVMHMAAEAALAEAIEQAAQRAQPDTLRAGVERLRPCVARLMEEPQ
ncbi:ATP-binding protein [Uliginosibacterium sp. sgz301328]|uniref:ATP-binding protein n=1 Tax=Uliginosibacterium sp. sgz301328 TaxID=3243764 RepID=UPI00359F0D6C